MIQLICLTCAGIFHAPSYLVLKTGLWKKRVLSYGMAGGVNAPKLFTSIHAPGNGQKCTYIFSLTSK